MDFTKKKKKKRQMESNQALGTFLDFLACLAPGDNQTSMLSKKKHASSVLRTTRKKRFPSILAPQANRIHPSIPHADAATPASPLSPSCVPSSTALVW
jgi:hypothetical protein